MNSLIILAIAFVSSVSSLETNFAILSQVPGDNCDDGKPCGDLCCVGHPTWVCCSDNIHCAGSTDACPSMKNDVDLFAAGNGVRKEFEAGGETNENSLASFAASNTKSSSSSNCNADQTDCQVGCCPHPGWVCCPDNINCAVVLENCPKDS